MKQTAITVFKHFFIFPLIFYIVSLFLLIFTKGLTLNTFTKFKTFFERRIRIIINSCAIQRFDDEWLRYLLKQTQDHKFSVTC